MKTTDLFKQKTVFSFEVFPPKRDTGIESIYATLDELKDLKPDSISVTYGAGGSESSNRTLKIASDIKNKYHIESVAHLTCIGLSREYILSFLEQAKSEGIDNILALRGDIPEGYTYNGDFSHANELISFIKQNSDMNILAACYPEKHMESANVLSDIRYLKKKVDAGASHLISQLFFDNSFFYSFKERCSLAGIDVPIEAGIMPVVNKKQIERMVTLCGATLPSKFSNMMSKYADNPDSIRDAGIAYAVDQIVDLITNGVDGIHLYTMNNPYIARKIYEAVHNLL